MSPIITIYSYITGSLKRIQMRAEGKVNVQPSDPKYTAVDVASSEHSVLENRQNVSGDAPFSKRAKYEKKPQNSIRYDGKNHLPQIDDKKNGTRCKNENCKSKSHTLCSKCDVHLCPRCFKPFHETNIS